MLKNKTSITTTKTWGKMRAFTLIELLVVIAIIALLAAILFPVFARVREKARAAACQSNMKQIALAFLQYSSDFDERLPHSWDSNLDSIGGTSNTCENCIISTNNDRPIVWPAKILPYAKTRKIFTCPSATTLMRSPCNTTAISVAIPVWGDNDPVIGYVPSAASRWYTGASQVGYGYNTYFLGGNRYVGWGPCLNQGGTNSSLPYSNGIGAALSSIADSSRTVLIIDNSFANQGISNAPAFADFPNWRALNIDIHGDVQCRDGGGADGYDTVPTRHNSGLNVAFVDGHVKWMKKEKLLEGLPSWTCQGTNPLQAHTYSEFIWNRF